MLEKQALARAIEIPNESWGITMHFKEIIKQITIILKSFKKQKQNQKQNKKPSENVWLLLKFFIWILIALAKIFFLCIVVNRVKIPLN